GIKRNETGEKTVQPIALLLGERRAFRHEHRNGRRHVRRHPTASASHMAFNASTSCRREKVRNVSLLDLRLVRYARSICSMVRGTSVAFTSLKSSRPMAASGPKPPPTWM